MAATTYDDVYADWDGDDRGALTTKYISKRFPKYHNKYNTEPYTPVYKIMKEFYDEEKEDLYCTPYASIHESKMQYWDIFYDIDYNTNYNTDSNDENNTDDDADVQQSEHVYEREHVNEKYNDAFSDEDDNTDSKDEGSVKIEQVQFYDNAIYKKFSYT